MWHKCSNGHDLTANNAYVYRNDGKRECRECAIPPKQKRSPGTWHDKRNRTRETFA